MDPMTTFAEGLTYEAFLEAHGTDEQKRRWAASRGEVQLSDAQRTLLRGFTREMPVLVTAGAWCGDCVDQCPIFDRFAEQNELIRVRYFDRDAHPDLADALSICGGRRVPSVLFLAEDGAVCGRAGDRTLAKYRRIAADQLGAACPTGLVLPDDDLRSQVVQEWLDEFERIQLMLRTSARLRQLHGD